MFCAMTGAKRVVEIGTFTGYSALCMAEALPADGEVHTIDINDELEELILNGFERAGEVGKKDHFHNGDASELIPQMDGEFDVCFMDGNKRHYMSCVLYFIIFAIINLYIWKKALPLHHD